MPRKNKKGEYEHFCVLIVAQGQWSDSDRQSVEEPIRKVITTHTPDPYPFFLKLTRRTEDPQSCKMCTPAYELLLELKGQADGIIYFGHHYIIPMDDLEDMARFVKMVLDNEKVKKMHMLYLDGFGEIKRTELSQWDLETLKSHIETKTCNMSDFLKQIENGKFDNRVLYEIVKW
ncbi:MAG: hypothetical protein KGD60_10925 [Candidatus Thorarchaeota archaeon]|nr:hypothetical protein [Candidatus Thorarchaeota archaeon]